MYKLQIIIRKPISKQYIVYLKHWALNYEIVSITLLLLDHWYKEHLLMGLLSQLTPALFVWHLFFSLFQRHIPGLGNCWVRASWLEKGPQWYLEKFSFQPDHVQAYNRDRHYSGFQNKQPRSEN